MNIIKLKKILREIGKMVEPLIQKEYRGHIIVEQDIVADKRLYIITRNKNNGKYTLWFNNKKLGEANDPNYFNEKMK